MPRKAANGSGKGKAKASPLEAEEEIARPPNAWIIFRSERSKHHTSSASSRGITMTVGEISKLISKEYRALPEDRKKHYESLAEAAKKQHEIDYPNYKFSPKSKELKDAIKAEKKKQKQELKERQKQEKRSRSRSAPSLPSTSSSPVNDDDADDDDDAAASGTFATDAVATAVPDEDLPTALQSLFYEPSGFTIDQFVPYLGQPSGLVPQFALPTEGALEFSSGVPGLGEPAYFEQGASTSTSQSGVPLPTDDLLAGATAAYAELPFHQLGFDLSTDALPGFTDWIPPPADSSDWMFGSGLGGNEQPTSDFSQFDAYPVDVFGLPIPAPASTQDEFQHALPQEDLSFGAGAAQPQLASTSSSSAPFDNSTQFSFGGPYLPHWSQPSSSSSSGLASPVMDATPHAYDRAANQRKRGRNDFEDDDVYDMSRVKHQRLV